MHRQLLDIEQAARLLDIHPITLYRWVRQKRVPAIRFGPRMIRFDPKALEKFLAQKTVEVREPAGR